MTNYVKTTDFAAKDNTALPDAQRLVKGTEFEVEFDNIADAIASKANTASPALTGVPTAPTAVAGTNTTQLATTAFVYAERSNTATLTNKTLTNCAANTPSTSDNDTSIATTAFVKAALQLMYPIGSVYINASSTTNPATLLGFGTWTEIGAGRVLVGQDTDDSSFNSMGETGGSKNATLVSHTHTQSGTFTTTSSGNHTHSVIDPGHQHSVYPGSGTKWFTAYSSTGGNWPSENVGNTQTQLSSSETTGIYLSTNGAHTHTVSLSGNTGSSGSSATNANLQPYVVVKMWKRTA